MNTTIVTGLTGGGTTCAARVVDALGIPMIESIPATKEDWVFNRKLEAGRWGDLRVHIAYFNARFPSGWGFKCPNVFGHIQNRLNRFVNPRIIYVFRDPISVQNTHQRHGNASQNGVVLAVEEYVRMAHLIPTCGVPYLFVSYEQLMLRTQEAVASISKWLQIEGRDAAACNEVRFNDPRYNARIVSGRSG